MQAYLRAAHSAGAGNTGAIAVTCLRATALQPAGVTCPVM